MKALKPVNIPMPVTVDEPVRKSVMLAEAAMRENNAAIEEELTALNKADSRFFRTLWIGAWEEGTIQVDDITDYNLFLVKMDGQGTAILAIRNGKYFRGTGGFCASDSTETDYYVAATIVDETLTLVSCHSITQAGVRTNRTITEIIGIL